LTLIDLDGGAYNSARIRFTDQSLLIQGGSTGGDPSTTYITMLANGGYVGLNTSPLARLHVDSVAGFTLASTQAGQDNIYITNNTNGSAINNVGPSIGFGGPGVDGRRASIASIQGGSDPDSVGIAFYTHPTATGADNLVEALRINYNGLVEINGATTEMLRLSDTSISGSPMLSFYQTTTRRSYIQHNDTGDNLQIASEYGDVSISTGTGGTESERLRVNSAGSVLIGTATTVGSILEVYGGDASSYGQVAIRSSSTTGESRIAFYQTTTKRAELYHTDSDNTLILNSINGGVNICGSNTARIVMSSAGALQFTAYGAGYLKSSVSGVITSDVPSYGAISYSGIVAVGYVGAGVDYKRQVDFNALQAYSDVTPSSATDDITITAAGNYKIEATLTFIGYDANSRDFSIGIYKNNGATLLGIATAGTNIPTTDKYGTATCNSIVTLAVNDTVELWTWNEDVGTSNVYINSAVLSVVRVS